MSFKDDFSTAKKFAETTNFSDYKRRKLMYSGKHWDPLLITTAVSPDASTPKINYIKPNLNHMVSMLSMENPTIVVTPEEKSDVPLATDIGSLVKRVYNKRKVDKISQIDVKDMLIYSKGYLGVRWNPDLDKGDGDIEPYFINPFNIFMEPVAYSLSDSFYVHIKWLRSKHYIWNKYKKDIEDNGEDLFNSEKKGVEIVESWYLPCKEYPEGRHIIWTETEDGILLDEEPPYYNVSFPIVEFEYDKVSTGDVSSMAEEMWGNQEVYMKTLGLIIDNLRFTNNGKYVTNWETAPETIPTAPNTVIKIPSAIEGGFFNPLANPPINPAWFSLLADSVATFPDISGVREVNMGTTSGGVTAASAIVALQEATKTRRDDIKEKIIAPAMNDFGKISVALMQQFYDSDKITKILAKELVIDDPKILDYDIEFQYTQALPTDKATRLNLGMQLKQTELLDAQAFAELFDDPVLAKLIMDTAKRKAEFEKQQMELALKLQGQQGQGQTRGQTVPTQSEVPKLEGIGGK